MLSVRLHRRQQSLDDPIYLISAFRRGGLIEKAGEFEEARQRIRDDANRKRAEAASAGLVGRAAAKAKEEPTLVVPQSEGQQKNGPNPDQKPARANFARWQLQTRTRRKKGLLRATLTRWRGLALALVLPAGPARPRGS